MSLFTNPVSLNISLLASDLPQWVATGGWALGILLLYVVGAVSLRLVVERGLSRFELDQAVTKLLSQLAFYGLLIVGIVSTLESVGVSVSALVASLGLGGFALGFALRDAISNLLAGVLILIHRPFRTGQWIEVDKQKGRVEEINLRYTVLVDGARRFLVPNQLTFTKTIAVEDEDPSAPQPS